MVFNFLFHRVNPRRDILWDPMDVGLFDSCIHFLSKNFEVVLLEDLLLNSNGIDKGRKYATVVFDDGYKDNFEYALPILEKYGVKASFYVVTDCIDKNIPTWTHILDHSFQSTAKDRINLDFDFLPSDLRIKELKSQKARIDYVRKLKPALKKITHQERILILQEVNLAFNDVEVPGLMMNWSDLSQIRLAGHYIGSHTVTHCMLASMHIEEEIKAELVNSGERIRQELGYFPSTISYPVGSYNTETMRLSQEAGYKLGLAVNQRPYNPAVHSLFEIPRIELYNESWFKTRLRITNVLPKLSKLLKRI